MFILIYLFVYGTMHAYILLRARAALEFPLRTAIIIALCMALMMAAPIIVRIMERGGVHDMSRILSIVSFSWLGLVFLFVCTALAVDMLRFLMSAISFVASESAAAGSTVGAELTHTAGHGWLRAAFYIPLVVAFAAFAYGYSEGNSIRVERIEINSVKLAGLERPLRIVQISDLHLGIVMQRSRLARIVEAIDSAGPDMVLSTGDMVDGLMPDRQLSWMLNSIDAPYGKFAVMGNHEYYVGIKQSTEITEAAGFMMLTNQSETISAGGIELNIGGADFTGRRHDAPQQYEGGPIITGNDNFTVLLKHEPYVSEPSVHIKGGAEVVGGFDLQLSGHTHNGQIFPFMHIVKLLYPYIAGLYDVGAGSRLYVNRGTGLWGPPIRILSPPEVTLIELMPYRRQKGIQP